MDSICSMGFRSENGMSMPYRLRNARADDERVDEEGEDAIGAADETGNPVLAANMKRWMKDSGLTSVGKLRAAMLAAGYHIGTQTIHRAIKGQVGNRLESLQKIAAFFHVDVDQLLQPQGIEPLAWPFSVELHQEISKLPPPDLQHMERSMWGFLRKSAPPELHYEDEALRVIGDLTGMRAGGVTGHQSEHKSSK
jgi:hypothetical protein